LKKRKETGEQKLKGGGLHRDLKKILSCRVTFFTDEVHS